MIYLQYKENMFNFVLLIDISNTPQTNICFFTNAKNCRSEDNRRGAKEALLSYVSLIGLAILE